MQRLDRRRFLELGAMLPATAALARSQGELPRLPRNVLVLVADDLSRFDVGAYGNPKITTPEIDALARAGVRFECGYTASSICKPSRAALYTGLYPHENGATGFKPLDAAVVTLPSLIPREVAATALIGKVHVDPIAKLPFELLRNSDDQSFGPTRAAGSYAKWMAEFLEHAGERRFCAFVCFDDPHRPFDEGGAISNSHSPDDVWMPPHLIDTFQARVEMSHYYDAVFRLDQAVGAVLAQLAESGRADDTLVLFTADNGQPHPFAKTTLYEAGINVPFVARWPALRPVGSSAALVSLLDVVPTVLESFGLDAPAGLDGRSLLPLLRGESASIREFYVGEHNEHRHDTSYPMRSVRKGRWKFILNFHPEREFRNSVTEVGKMWTSWERDAARDAKVAARLAMLTKRPQEELFDLERDPFELESLAGAEEHAATRLELRALLHAWLVEAQDPLLSEWPFES